MQGWGRIITAALAATALAAPATAAAQAGPHKVDRIVPFTVQADDGARLRGHVYLPDKAGPLPTVLNLTPYLGTSSASKSTNGRMNGQYGPMLEAGYAIAFVSMRGTGRSEGCLQFGGEQDQHDARTIIEALADQPWSNGRIGMYGLSYDAFSQFLAMAAKPPSLKAVVPMSGVIDLWSLLTRRGAAFQIAGPLFAPAWAAQTSLGVADAVAAQHAGCPNIITSTIDNLQLQFGADRSPWFEERDLRDEIAGSRIPAFVTNGMSMLRMPGTAQEGHILQFEGLWDLLRKDRTRFMLGQWPHSWPTNRPDFYTKVLDFFDEHLKGEPRKLQMGVVEYQDSQDGTWHTADRWPPHRSSPRLYLSGDRITTDKAKVADSDRRFQSAPHDPGLRVQPQNDPRDGKPYLSPCGPTQVLYVSPPAAEDVHLAGEFDVDLTISSTLPGGNFAFFVHRTTGTGACPDDKAIDTGRAIMDLQHFKVAGRSEPFPVGHPTRLRFHSHPMSAMLRKGERLVVAIGGGASEVTVDQLAPVITVHTGPGTTSSFTLPVESGTLRFEEETR
jgi:putative CocE/NonD family hydrolase